MMKPQLFLLSILSLSLAAAGPEKEQFPEFDTRRPVQEKELAAPAGEPLFNCRFNDVLMNGKDRWGVTKHVFSMKKVPDAEKILKTVQTKAEKECFRLSVGKEAVNFRDPASGRNYEVECGVVKNFPLRPDMAGKDLRVEFQYTGSGPMQLFITFPGKSVFRCFDPENRGILKKTVTIPAGAKNVVFNCWLRGAGTTALTSAEAAVCTPAADLKKADARIYLNSFMEEDFRVPDSNYAFPVFWVVRVPEKRKYTDIQLEIELPDGYEFAGYDKKMPILKKEGNRYLYDLSYYATFAGEISPGKFCQWVYPCLMLRSKRPAGTSGILTSRVIEQGKASPVRRTLLKTVPFVKGTMPKDFWYGYSQTRGGNMDTVSAKELVKLLKDSGFNHMSAQNDKSKELNEEFLRSGFELFNCAPSIRDGYFTVFAPPEAEFLDYDQKPYKHYVCPEEIGNRGSFYQKLEKELIEPKVKDWTNHWMVNWEPYPADYHGCFCQRCRKAFAAYASLDPALIAKMPGKEIMKKYHDPWVKFRSLQHGRIIKVLEESISRLAAKHGKKCHFMPEISFECFYDGTKYCNQYQPEDYLKYMKEVNIWGPYIYKGDLYEPYRYRTGANLLFYVGARGIMDFVARHSGKNPPPDIMFMPWGVRHTEKHGLRGFHFDNICAFLAGGRGSSIYNFPGDYRTWETAALDSRMLAAAEKMRFWKKSSRVSSEIITPAIRPEHWKVVTEKNQEAYPEIRKISSPLLTEAREKDGRIWIAAGNFWEMGKVYFRLKVNTPVPGQWILSIPHEKRFMRVTSAGLQKGIVMGLDPLDWNFFLLEQPVKGKDYGKEISRSIILNNMKKDLPGIRRALAFEDQLLRDYNRMTRMEDYDFGAVPEITGGTVTAKELRKNGTQMVSISGTGYTAILNPAVGGGLSSLKIGKTELVYATDKDSFSSPAFWMPVRGIFSKPCRIMKIEPQSKGIRILLERQDEELNLKIGMEYLFADSRIFQTATVTNMSKSPQELALRNHNYTFFVSPGSEMTWQGGSLKFRSGSAMYSLAGAEKALFADSLRGIRISPVLKGNTFTLQKPGNPVALHFHTGSPLFGIFLWIPDQASKAGTFEPTYMPVRGKLKSGESRSFSCEWSWTVKDAAK